MNKDQFAYLQTENNDLREMLKRNESLKRELVEALKKAQTNNEWDDEEHAEFEALIARAEEKLK